MNAGGWEGGVGGGGKAGGGGLTDGVHTDRHRESVAHPKAKLSTMDRGYVVDGCMTVTRQDLLAYENTRILL